MSVCVTLVVVSAYNSLIDRCSKPMLFYVVCSFYAVVFVHSGTLASQAQETRSSMGLCLSLSLCALRQWRGRRYTFVQISTCLVLGKYSVAATRRVPT